MIFFTAALSARTWSFPVRAAILIKSFVSSAAGVRYGGGSESFRFRRKNKVNGNFCTAVHFFALRIKLFQVNSAELTAGKERRYVIGYNGNQTNSRFVRSPGHMRGEAYRRMIYNRLVRVILGKRL